MADIQNQLPPSVENGKAAWYNNKRLIYIGGAIIAVGFLSYLLIGTSGKGNHKTGTQEAIDKMKASASKTGRADQTKDASSSVAKDSTPQPIGEPETVKAMEAARKRKADEVRLKAEWEEVQRQRAQFAAYQNKLRGLPYDKNLADSWEERVKKSMAAGLAPPQPIGASDEAIAFAKESGLMKEATAPVPPNATGTLTTKNGGKIKVGPEAITTGGPSQARGSAPSSKDAMAGVDPRTGLPSEVGAVSELSGYASDGTPDFEGGSIPVEFNFQASGPDGKTSMQKVTRWIRPPYLLGRVRPLDPEGVKDNEHRWEEALRTSTDIQISEQDGAVRLPSRIPATVSYVSSDFRHINRYSVVYPNPDTKAHLNPSNHTPIKSGSR